VELRIDSQTGLIDLKWCEAQQKAGLTHFGRPTFNVDSDERFDASVRADDAVPLARDLNYVLQTVRDTYRPLKWASVMPTVSVPDWAERWEISKITGTGGIALVSTLQNSDFIQADFSRETTTGRMYEFGNGYRYATREMVRAAKLGINPSAERAMLQAQAADEFLDSIAATGRYTAPNGTVFQVFAAGFATLTPSTDLPALIAAVATKGPSDNTTSWTAADDADFSKVLLDLHVLTDAVYVNSKERRYADTLVMPLDEFQALNRIRATNFSANVLTTFQEEWNRKIGRTGRIVVWDRLKDVGTIATGPRVVAFDGSSDQVAALVMGKPYGVDQVVEKLRGYEAVATLITGGFRALDTNGMAYMDIAA
jgi:hypothetical protein